VTTVEEGAFMEPARAVERRWDWVWLVVCGVASSAWCISASTQIGATFDEPGYLARGLEFWRTGNHAAQLKLGTMPLPMDLASLPLYVSERLQGAQLDFRGDDLRAALPWARAVTLGFWWLLLTYVLLAGRRLAGSWAARIAVALVACEPCFLAHACLATSDVAVTACLMALVYHFQIGRAGQWIWRVGVPGIWLGVALLSKASALAFGPLCLGVVELERLVRTRAWATSANELTISRFRWLVTPIRPFLRELVQMGTIAMVLTFVYCGSDWETQASFVKWAHQLPEGPAATATVWVADHLCIFPNAGDGLVRQIGHNLRGHPVYLFGETNARAIWYYFPLALSVKLSLPLLLLPLVLAALRPRSLLNWACLAAGCLLVYSLNCRVQIGIRFMLPLVALAIIGLSAAVVETWRAHASSWSRRALKVLVSGGIAWTSIAAIAVWPNGLCYSNEIWGGTPNGYRYLSDSNYDWGQGLHELARWRDANDVEVLDVWYFGTDSAIADAGFRYAELHKSDSPDPGTVVCSIPGRYLAASVTLLHGAYGITRNPTATKTKQQSIADYLRERKPVARTNTFFIFDFGDPITRVNETRVPVAARNTHP
jgi:hypothetical protein